MLISDLQTPSLVIDLAKLEKNQKRMDSHIAALGGKLRPHLKTMKSAALAKHLLGDLSHPITVSTLHEAEYFAENGAKDILYAVGITQNKLEKVCALINQGINLKVILDSEIAAQAIVDGSKSYRTKIPVLIEVDTDGHRAGVKPASKTLLAIAKILSDGEYSVLAGVLTHAGGSYGCKTTSCIEEYAARERELAVASAEYLRGAGYQCPIVSIGSTPTTFFSRNFDSVTEVRAGVYMSFDLVMAGLGVCNLQEIAISVLTTVIGHQTEKGWAIVDAGWMAMSQDRSTASHSLDQGYGLVCSETGVVFEDVIMKSANQEHGILQSRNSNTQITSELFPVGTKLRILPNHACATAAQFDRYHVVGDDNAIVNVWERINGW